MKVVAKRDRELVILLPSEANFDLGIFLIFFGIVAVPPLYWLYYWFTQREFHGWSSWRPSIFIATIFVLCGILLIFFSKKRITAANDHINIKDGLLKSSYNIRWKNTPAIKLNYDEEERKGRIKEYWETTLLDGKLEYTIDRREHHQLEARALGEVLARHYACNFVEKDEEGQETVLSSDDLDLPFRQRVKKYPRLLRNPVDPPSRTILKIEQHHRALLMTWGIKTTGILIDIFALFIIFFIFSILPWKEGGMSFYEECAKKQDFFVYVAAGIILILAMLVVIGYRARLNLSPVGAIFWVTIWGVALRRKKIMIDWIEEIRLTPGMRGPRIQIISDREIISFRLFDRHAARWLSYKLQQFMLGSSDKPTGELSNP